jgi:NAD(P)-dependent dehydrogenase (short-subunit alcohol dehydrogenase family)
VLIHNAGAIHTSYQTNDAGTELTIAGQVIAPFLLTSLLLPALLAAGQSRVITVSSAGMYTQRLEPAILQIPASGYRGVTAYARAKRAQVALSREWARRLAGTGIAFHAMRPGWVNTPGIATALPRFHTVMRPLLRTPPRAPTRSSGSPPPTPPGLAAARSGMTGARAPNTGSPGPASHPPPRGSSGTRWSSASAGWPGTRRE